MRLTLVGVAGCLFDWIATRRWKILTLYFLPLFIAIFAVGVTSAGNWLSRQGLTERYLQLANAEVDEWERQWAPKSGEEEPEVLIDRANPPKPKEIPASAEMLFRRVQQLQQNDSRSMFFVAMCYLQRGAVSQGLNLINRLAPPDRNGYPPAHAYLAERMLMQPQFLKVSDLPLLRHHARMAVQWNRISPQLLSNISDLYARLNELDNAVEVINLATKIDKKYYLLLGQMTQGSDKYSKLSDESLEKAYNYFTEKLTKKPQDIGTRLMLADTQCLRSELEAAEQTILDGMKLSDDQILKTALSEIYCRVFVKTSEIKNGNWTGNIELLEKAFRLDPNNLHVFEEVAKLARASGTVPNEELMAQLRQNLLEGRATSVTHMWIAEHYLNTNQFAKAVPHLEQAVKRDPASSRCWNNLAYCLADLYPNRLEEALKDADIACAISPQMPDFHDTRGTILMKLKRPGDAVAAFENAIEAIARTKGAVPPQPAFHQRLAEAYLAVGDKTMAETHQRFAESLIRTRQDAKNEEAAKEKPSDAKPRPEQAKPKAPVEASTAPTATGETEKGPAPQP